MAEDATDTQENVMARMARTLVRIEESAPGGLFKMQGTGFVVRPDYSGPLRGYVPNAIVTAAHVVKGASTRQLYVRYHDNSLARIDVNLHVMVSHSSPYEDVAVFAAPKTGAHHVVFNLQVVEREAFMTWEDIIVGDPTVAPGFLGALGYVDGTVGPLVYRSGSVAAKTTRALNLSAYSNSPAGRLLLVDAPSYPGNSGGPVYLNPLRHRNRNLARAPEHFFMGIVVAYVPAVAPEGYVEETTKAPTEKTEAAPTGDTTVVAPEDATKETTMRKVFVDNTDVAIVIPAPTVAEAVDEFAKAWAERASK